MSGIDYPNKTLDEFCEMDIKANIRRVKVEVIHHNRDERWLRNRWNKSDFKITESRRLNFGKESLVYYDITNKITKVTFNILISSTDLEDCLKTYDWGERP